jgi:hypothetical protein
MNFEKVRILQQQPNLPSKTRPNQRPPDENRANQTKCVTSWRP